MAQAANDTDQIRATSPMQLPNGEPWSSAEIARLRSLANLGVEALADVLGRSVASVKMQAHRQGISLRIPGQRGGRLLGLPNGVAQAAIRVGRLRQMRELVLAGEIDPSSVVRYVRWMSKGKPLCPNCTRNPAEVESSGFCRPCHLRLLADGEDYALEIRDAQRENDRVRQRRHRAKVREA